MVAALAGMTSAKDAKCHRLHIMSEHQKQTAFLKKLVMHVDTPENRALCERLTQTEHSERCTQCACRLVGLIALLGLAGLGYAAVLLPQFFDNSTHFIVRICSALGLGSTACFAAFLMLWYSYRRATNQLHAQCRIVIAKMWAEKFLEPATGAPVIRDGSAMCVEVLRRSMISTQLAEPGFKKAS